MADPVPEESSLAEELTCSVCCDLLNDPVMLDCMHHFCRACILRFWDSSHRVSDCPYCRKVMPNRFVRTNHLLQKVVDLVRKNSRPEYHNNIQKNLKEMLEARENLMKTLEQQKEKAENKICNVEKTCWEIKQHIAEDFCHLHDILTKEERGLLSVVEMEQRTTVGRLQDIVTVLEKKMEDLDKEITTIQETVEKTGDALIIAAEALIRRTAVNTDYPTLDNLDLASKYKGPFQYMVWRRMFKFIHPVPEPLTFDTSSAHPSLVFSNDLKSVTDSDKPLLVPALEDSTRFLKCVNVLASQAFYTGRHYWEVWVDKKTKWDIGVASHIVDRKARVKLAPKNGYWAIRMIGIHKYVAATAPWTLLRMDQPLRKIGVFLDCGEEEVSFFNAEDMVHLFTFNRAKADGFYPFFSTGFNDGARNAEPMRICHITL